VFAEYELFLDANNIFLVIWIILTELFHDLGFDQALLI
jgi:hypothetical protein